MEMLEYGVAPQKFWVKHLLLELLPLFEIPNVIVFDVQDTYQLMESLEEITMSHRSDE
jgi:hypothetical protein